MIINGEQSMNFMTATQAATTLIFGFNTLIAVAWLLVRRQCSGFLIPFVSWCLHVDVFYLFWFLHLAGIWTPPWYDFFPFHAWSSAVRLHGGLVIATVIGGYGIEFLIDHAKGRKGDSVERP